MAYEDKHSDASSSLLSEHEAESERYDLEQRPHWRRNCYTWTAINALLLLTSVCILAYTLLSAPSEHDMLRRTSFPSPMWDKIKQSTHRHEIDGTLFSTQRPSKFRNGVAPSADVDDAWHAFELIRTFPISRADVQALGKDPATAVRYPRAYGLGDEAYVAQLDVFHQIHCLNLLRTTAWAEFARDPARGKRRYSDLHWIHVAHCTEVLLQNVMCAASMDLVTFNWKQTQDLPFADFNVNHQCRDFDALVKWQDQHALSVERARNFTRPDDQAWSEVPMGKKYFELFGYEVPTDLHHGEAHDHVLKGDVPAD